MGFAKFTIFLLALILHSAHSYGQDTIIPSITKIPLKFIQQTNDKIDKYSNRITSKTEKTLQKLTKWENKIQSLLLKANPAVAEQLFGEGKQTFAGMLQKIQEGKALTENFRPCWRMCLKLPIPPSHNRSAAVGMQRRHSSQAYQQLVQGLQKKIVFLRNDLPNRVATILYCHNS